MSTSTTREDGVTSQTLAASLIGLWKNELGSLLMIDEHNDNFFKGAYLTAVKSEKTKEDIKLSPLAGYQQQDTSYTFGFTIKWSFSDSTTAFVGQYFPNTKDGEILETMWLIRSNVDDHGKDWEATSVGKNTFVKWSVDKCSPEIVAIIEESKTQGNCHDSE